MNNDEELDKIVISPVQTVVKKPAIEIVSQEENKITEVDTKIPPSKEKSLTKSQGLARQVEKEINSTITCKNVTTTKFKRPANAVQFSKTWTSVQDKVSFLNKFRTQDYPSVFKQSMEPNMFSEILQVLVDVQPVSPHLLGLSRIPRISALIMFLEKSDSELLKKLIAKGKAENVMSAVELKHLGNIFGG